MRASNILLAVAGLGTLVGAAVIGQRALVASEHPRTPDLGPREAAPPAAEADAPPAPAAALVRERIELVVRQAGALERANEQGGWSPLSNGDVLVETDRIRAAEGGRAILETVDGSRVELVDEVEVAVGALSRSIAELELGRGRVRADLTEGSSLAIRVRAAGAVAEGRGGAFTVYADGAGMVAVASETASVALRAREESVTVAAGEQSVVLPGGTPSDPEAIPEQVFLSIAWPEQRLTRDRQLRVRGTVSPGTEVRVDGRRAAVDRAGGFEASLILDAGPNELDVTARDPSGRTRTERSPAIVLKNRPPRLEPVGGGLWQE